MLQILVASDQQLCLYLFFPMDYVYASPFRFWFWFKT